MCVVGLGSTGVVVCANTPSSLLERALARGFVAAEVPVAWRKASFPLRTLAVPRRRQLARRAGQPVVVGDAIGPFGLPPGRLGPVFLRGEQLLAFSAGHVFRHEGEPVYCGGQPIGRVLCLARPRSAGLDAAVIELGVGATAARLAGGSHCSAGHAEPRCGERLYRAISRSSTREGHVTMAPAAARIRFGTDEFWLADQFVVEGKGFAVPGDSGCALVGEDGVPRGMLIAGEAGVYVATPISRLLEVFALDGAGSPSPEPRRAA